MINFPFKRIFGMIGIPRAGKDEVANFLTETRGFTRIAFADQVKQEFGISNTEFEASKISGNIDELRKKLWEFSAVKKSEDPEYFIRRVIDKVKSSENSVIITDIRTPEELSAFWKIKSCPGECIRRVYWIKKSGFSYDEDFDENDNLIESKLSKNLIMHQINPAFPEFDIRLIENNQSGLYYFYKHLDYFFFNEDIEDFINDPKKHSMKEYTYQFDIHMKGL